MMSGSLSKASASLKNWLKERDSLSMANSTHSRGQSIRRMRKNSPMTTNEFLIANFSPSATNSSTSLGTKSNSQQSLEQPSSRCSSVQSSCYVYGKIDYKAIPIQDEDGNNINVISFKMGDVMEVINQSRDDYLIVKHVETKEAGFVPSSFVTAHRSRCFKPIPEFMIENMHRKKCEAFFTDNHIILPRGAFLIRSKLNDESLALSILDVKPELDEKNVDIKKCLKHYVITYEENRYFIGRRHSFDTLEELVEYFSNTQPSKAEPGLCCRLTFPAPRIAAGADSPDDWWHIDRNELQIIKPLGSGHFGRVSKAVWRGQVECAVKIMLPNTMTCEQFLSEGAIMRNCCHPRLVRLFGVCTRIEPLMLVCEYMQKGMLRDYLRNNENITIDQLVKWAENVADGMSYLEENRMVHRDLAARNVLLNIALTAKVADFGLARILMENDYLARSGTTFPLKWTAPEAAARCKFSIESDVWSYGIFLYELFTRGGVPYPGMENKDVVNEVRNGFRMSCPTEVPDWAYDQMLHCWREDPQERPSFFELKKWFRAKSRYLQEIDESKSDVNNDISSTENAQEQSPLSEFTQDFIKKCRILNEIIEAKSDDSNEKNNKRITSSTQV